VRPLSKTPSILHKLCGQRAQVPAHRTGNTAEEARGLPWLPRGTASRGGRDLIDAQRGGGPQGGEVGGGENALALASCAAMGAAGWGAKAAVGAAESAGEMAAVVAGADR
jgi:hypothetical protein